MVRSVLCNLHAIPSNAMQSSACKPSDAILLPALCNLHAGSPTAAGGPVLRMTQCGRSAGPHPLLLLS